jgi:hypothetical protein
MVGSTSALISLRARSSIGFTHGTTWDVVADIHLINAFEAEMRCRVKRSRGHFHSVLVPHQGQGAQSRATRIRRRNSYRKTFSLHAAKSATLSGSLKDISLDFIWHSSNHWEYERNEFPFVKQMIV